MGSGWLVVYLIAAGLALLQAALVGMQAWEHRRFARSRLKALPWCRPSGRAVLFVPCRGGDVGLEENLRHLFLQDYGDYQIHFILEDPDDPAWPIIHRVAARHPRIVARVVFAGRARFSGQKVHNLRMATLAIDPEVEYLTFVDADARPGPGWLRAMLARLDLQEAAAVTGYRWFVPERPSLANLILYSVNCGTTSLLGKKGPTYVWGGSWAIRRSTFQRVGLAEAWKGTLSDDLVAGRVLKHAGDRVAFEPAAMVGSPLDYDFRGMLSFLRRQYVIGRFYAPGLWIFGLAMMTFANGMLLGSLAAALWGLVGGDGLWWVPATVALLLYLAGVFRGVIRQDAALNYFPRLEGELRAARHFDVWAAPLSGLVAWLAMISSSVGRHITWRGITYWLHAGGQISPVDRTEGLPAPAADEPGQPLPAAIEIQPDRRYRKAG